MPELRTIAESSHLARTIAVRLAERAHDVMWWLARRPLPMVLLRDQQPLTESELHRANSIIDWIEQVIEARPEYLERHRLSETIHCPQAIWALDKGEGLYDGFRAVCSRDPKVLNHLRLWTQQFTGYRLLSMELAEGRPFPRPQDVDALVDEKLLALGAAPDFWVGRYIRLSAKLPPYLRISRPRQLGEIGWNVDGRTLSYDSYVYLERLAMMHECGVIDRLRQIAAAGRTPFIVEIGGGFGGLAYHLARIIPQARIVIVDIPESLIFSSLYLSLLLPKRAHVLVSPEVAGQPFVPESAGCTFVPNYLFDRLIETGPKFDLAINTLSMSEMDAPQVEYYCRGLDQLLSDEGVFFEQNQDNTALGRLDARTVIAEHFRYRQDLHSRLVGSLTQGTAHLWGKQALPPFGEHRPASFRPAAKHREFHSMSAPNSRVDRIHSSSQ
jgi:putative sugar O-methyltransferase